MNKKTSPSSEEMAARYAKINSTLKDLKVIAPKSDVPSDAHEHAGNTVGDSATATSVRRVTYKKHDVEVTTSYQLKIDGKPVHGHFSVNDAGMLRCHDFPNYVFSSALDLSKRLVDLLPEGKPIEDKLNPDGDKNVCGGKH